MAKKENKVMLSDQEVMGLQKRWSELEQGYSKDLDRLIKDHNSPNKYKVKHRDHYTLVATSGDLGARGMGHSATQYRITPNQYQLVKDYIDFEYLYEQYMSDAFTLGYTDYIDRDKAIAHKFNDHHKYMIDLMINSGPFESKYAFRSTWCLLESPEYDYAEEAA